MRLAWTLSRQTVVVGVFLPLILLFIHSVSTAVALSLPGFPRGGGNGNGDGDGDGNREGGDFGDWDLGQLNLNEWRPQPQPQPHADDHAFEQALIRGDFERVQRWLPRHRELVDNGRVLELVLCHAFDDHEQRRAVIMEWLLDSQVVSVHHNNDRALRLAVELNRIQIVELLLDHGADVHAMEEQPLAIAVELGYLPIVQLLLRRGADPHAQSDWPIKLAAEAGHLEILVVLLRQQRPGDGGGDDGGRDDGRGDIRDDSRGNDVGGGRGRDCDDTDRGCENEDNSRYQTLRPPPSTAYECLQRASRHGHWQIVEFLLMLGVEAGSEGRNGPVEFAVLFGRVHELRLLLQFGAPVTPLCWEIIQSQRDASPEIVDLLREYADVSVEIPDLRDHMDPREDTGMVSDPREEHGSGL